MPDATLTPPIGDTKQAAKYLDQLIALLNADKATLTHSDLSQFEPTTIQDHYRIGLGDYDAEISHSINASTQQPLYIMVFTNVAHIKAGLADTAILSYIYLDEALFNKFKTATADHFERKRREAEAKRFTDAMEPVDMLIAKALASAPAETPAVESSVATPTFDPTPASTNSSAFAADFLAPEDQKV